MKKYRIIYADPPWKFSAWNEDTAMRHVSNVYPTMTIEEICSLKVNRIAESDSVLFMWATFPNLKFAFNVIDAWGFEYKTCAFVWVKTNQRFNLKQTSFLPTDSIDTFLGMGYYTRSNAELCLLGTRGRPLERKSRNVDQLIFAPMIGHSKKPAEARDRIVALFGDLPRIELFAREKVIGWDVFGNEVETKVSITNALSGC